MSVLPPTLTCAANVSVVTAAPSITSAAVTYGNPTVSGGTPPIISSCAPASGSTFSSGTTMVTCTGTDAVKRQAVCYLNVTVTVPAAPIPHLVGTNFLAFGDSITAGENGCNVGCILNVDKSVSYPTDLGTLLTQRYSSQASLVNVYNEGLGGESAQAGNSRIGAKIAADNPDALLLLEGVNDLYRIDSLGTPVSTPDQIMGYLRTDIETAKAMGVKKIFLATLTPEIPGGCSLCYDGDDPGVQGRAWGITPTDLLTPTNANIKQLAAQENVVFVDAFAALNANLLVNVTNPAMYVSDGGNEVQEDGLHLTIAGRAALAAAFFAAIEANFEAPASSSTQRKLPPGRGGLFLSPQVEVSPERQGQAIRVRDR